MGANTITCLYCFKALKSVHNASSFISVAMSREKLLLLYANNKGADLLAHPRSLISTFVVRCLDSIIPLVSISKISSL